MEEKQDLLNDSIISYYEFKNKSDELKKKADNYNKDIKLIMKELNIQNFETDNGLTAKITVQNRDSLNEEKAIEKLKTLGVTLPIKTKEYIDMEELENQIYLGKLNAGDLADCQIKKEVVTLSVKSIKENK